MTMFIEIANSGDAETLTELVNELLEEIMQLTGNQYFNIDKDGTAARARAFIEKGAYFAFMARNTNTTQGLGFIALSECHALYTEGIFGTIPELFVKQEHRSKGIGKMLREKAVEFAKSKGWARLEVTTPPIPTFLETLRFYETRGVRVTGGKKLTLPL